MSDARILQTSSGRSLVTFKERPETEPREVDHVKELANVACLVLTELLKGKRTDKVHALALRLDHALVYIEHDEHGSSSGPTAVVVKTTGQETHS